MLENAHRLQSLTVIIGAVYSFVLALVLSHIADAEEEDLRARFGSEYIEYGENVPKLFPHVQHVFKSWT